MTQILSLRRWRSRGWVRGIALLKVGALTLTGALADAQQAVSRAPAPTARAMESRVQDAAAPPPAPPTVRVNRQRPQVQAAMTPAEWPVDPSDADLFRMRVFDEPLVPVGRATTPAENRALAAGLRAYLAAPSAEATASLSGIFLTFPSSPWRASVLANIGTVFSQAGYFSRALQSWDEAWRLSKDATDRHEREVANYALGQWCDLMVKLGRMRELSARLDEVGARVVGGAAGSKVAGAREGLWLLTNQHHDAWSSGVAAVRAWLAATRNAPQVAAPSLDGHHASPDGMSLVELRTLAAGVELQLRPMFRPIGSAPLVAPAIVHLKVGHYSLVEKAEAGKLLLRDQILGTRWISPSALDDEASGYVLTAQVETPEGWRPVADSEASVVIGNCAPGAPNSGDPGPEEGDDDNGDGEADDDDGDGDDDEDGENDPDNDGDPDNDDAEDADSGSGDDDPNSCPAGLARYSFHPLTTALRFRDMPVGYEPPVGPMVHFLLSYNSREQQMPQIPTFGHLGPKWEHNWLSYIQEGDGGCTAFGCWNPGVGVHVRGAGGEAFDGAPDYTTVFGTDWRSKATLVRASRTPIRYERTLRDGTVEVFALADGAPERQRRVFLTEVIDPQGQRVQLTYDGTFRLVALTDAIGQVTTIAYEDASDPLRITKVTDPFGRFATFAYTSLGQLQSITDVAGMSSVFTYGPDDFIAARTTPYGTTTFRQNSTLAWPRFIEAIDPLGGRERLEFHYSNPAIPTTRPASEVPTGFAPANEHLEYYNSYYWDKRAIAHHPDLSKARMTHWLLEGMVSSSLPHSFQRPLESRIWFAYPGQNSVRNVGTTPEPSRIARVLDDGTTQQWQRTYNGKNRVTSRTDPAGRQRTYVYDTNEIDLLEVRQTTSGANDLLTRYAGYNARHQPASHTNASGQATSATYDSNGLLSAVTNAKGETITYGYESGQKRLASITGAAPGKVTTFAYDGYGRVRTTTDESGDSVTRDYDVFDRLVRVTYPDGTFEQAVFERLDAVAKRDRQGRWTRTTYDALRRPVAVRDPLGRTVTLRWCDCGSLEALVDARGQETRWERDLRGRVTREIRADGVTAIVLGYETTTSRLKTRTDPKLQVATYTYNIDDTLQSVVYTNASVATPTVSYTYDTVYKRILTMSSGVGTTTYTYKPLGSLGAGRFATEDGPFVNDTITYEYDELGRVTSRTVNGAAVTRTFDVLSRVTVETNPLGTFTYAYEGLSRRLSSVTYPNGLQTSYTYLSPAFGRRLETIHHRLAGGATLSKFDYAYDAVGNVRVWRQQADAQAPTEWRYTYDAADQLLTATRWTTGATPSIVKWLGYAYDAAGNRESEQVDEQTMRAEFDALNRMAQRHAGGAIRVAGQVSEPATVTIQGRPTEVAADGSFRGVAELAPGTTLVPVTATDAAGNPTTRQYEIDATAATVVTAYDTDGNMTVDGGRTLTWDGAGRLQQITEGSHTSEFGYDGRRRLATIVEKEAGAVVRSRQMTWCGGELCQIAEVTGGSRTQWLFTQGVKDSVSGNLYITRDHLGSVREIGDTRFDYDPYGRMERVSGTLEAPVGFTGAFVHVESELLIATFRAYSPGIGRWMSEDPIGLEGGINLYAYVGSNPATFVDPLGLIVIGNDPVLEALKRFWENYKKMREANVKNSDKYFHCMANCEASRSGSLLGQSTAKVVSELREFTDRYVKGDSAEQCAADRVANNWGRWGDPEVPCDVTCSPFRVNGLPVPRE